MITVDSVALFMFMRVTHWGLVNSFDVILLYLNIAMLHYKGIPIVKIRQFDEHLIFVMKIPCLKRLFILRWGPGLVIQELCDILGDYALELILALLIGSK